MDQFFSTIFNTSILGQPFQSWAPYLTLGLMAIALLAVWMELRLPMQAYWSLPGHVLKQLAYRIGLAKRPPTWGTCTNQQSGQPLAMVAVELLDLTTHKVLQTTYSDLQGAYGFSLQPGRYLIRASKSQYKQPSFINPQNIQVLSLDGVFVSEVSVVSHDVSPMVDLKLMPQTDQLAQYKQTSLFQAIVHTVIFQLGHLAIIAVALISLVGWWYDRDPLYALMLVLSLVLLFIKLYILQMIGILSADTKRSKKMEE